MHLWLGLLIGAHLVLMGLSGSALVFREEWAAALEPAVAPHQVYSSAAASASRISDTLSRELPGYAIRALVFPEGARPLRATLQRRGLKRVCAYLDPRTGALLAQTSETPLPDQLADFHHNLLLGRTGRVINGVMAVILLSLIASGLWLWLTQKRPLPLRLTVRWSNWHRAKFDLHTATGFWVSPLLVVIATTAMYFAWHEQAAKIINMVTFSAPAPAVPRVSGGRGEALLQDIVAAATRAMPQGRLSFIRFPERRGEQIVVRMKHADEWRSTGSSQVYLDPPTADVLFCDRTSERALGTRIVRNLAPLHFGEFGGWPTRLAWVALGLAPGLLFFTGFSIWRRKTR